ncbi:hypothetical protein MNBD_NITROSPINAE04-1253 [hydrothermal vent metagenome]|uniref:Anti-sigma-28 factor FlgM C-terminal domain-containing protein n=2 Tax=hydrothermal vent metagenome TaxID=652676 RepID=A0A3B1C4V7_9ZZZZ
MQNFLRADTIAKEHNKQQRKKEKMEGLPSVRSELIAKLKREVQDRTYKVKSQEIADKITQKLREEEAYTGSLRKNRWTA